MADPTWLPDVLRAAGLKCNIYPGAMDRGHGDFGSIWGVVCHHTGSNGAPAGSIANHPELGLASQLHLGRNGTFTLCGVGIAWHAGQGSWPGISTNNANQVTIGIEAANDGTSGWPPAQYDAYVRGVAAILKRLGQPASHAIGHKEWGAIQGKWDPGGIDMNAFRRDVAAAMADAPVVVVKNEIDEAAKVADSWIGARITKGENLCPDGKGRWAEFEHAHIYWRAGVGAFPIPHSGLFEAFAEVGWEAGPLGYPVRTHTVLDGGGVQAFQHGVLYRQNSSERGYYVTGKIGARWADEGYERGPLGWPTSNEFDRDGGRAQNFEHGVLGWRADGVVQIEAV